MNLYREVQVSYAGEWGKVVGKLQPVLVDEAFRKSSVETYRPRANSVYQVHTGPGGTKEVRRSPGKVSMIYNGAASGNPDAQAAAALVADAYTLFLFGSSWLVENGKDFQTLAPAQADGRSCLRVSGSLRPGLGLAQEDRFVAWIDEKSGLLKRIQFTLNGLATTQGADVDVTFSEHWKAPDGSVWPGRFIEYVHRPVYLKAHDWKMTGLHLNGEKVK